MKRGGSKVDEGWLHSYLMCAHANALFPKAQWFKTKHVHAAAKWQIEYR